MTSDVIDRTPGAACSGPDFFVREDGREFAGRHLIIDVRGAKRLDDAAHVEATLRACAAACGAAVLHVHVHRFSPSGGISGVAVLAESHIGVHTWPERGFAALDVFMCGRADARLAPPVVAEAFQSDDVRVTELLRGEDA